MDEEFDTAEEGLTSRAPRQKDLAALARELNRLGANTSSLVTLKPRKARSSAKSMASRYPSPPPACSTG